MSRGSQALHRHLQREAFRWALGQGFNAAALEVHVPQIGSRLDVAACKFEPPRKVRGSLVLKPGAVLVLECKTDRADFLRDIRSEEQLREQLSGLQKQRAILEESMRRDFPTLREGQTLFPEFDVYRFQEVAGAPYQSLLDEIDQLTHQLYSKGKFSKLIRWRGANLFYIVAEDGVAEPEEVPAGWGLLSPRETGVEVKVKATWQDAGESSRWQVATRIATTATEFLEEILQSETRSFLSTRTPDFFKKEI